jgi:hypothetical protein
MDITQCFFMSIYIKIYLFRMTAHGIFITFYIYSISLFTIRTQAQRAVKFYFIYYLQDNK